jgi:hypothetical protein
MPTTLRLVNVQSGDWMFAVDNRVVSLDEAFCQRFLSSSRVVGDSSPIA